MEAAFPKKTGLMEKHSTWQGHCPHPAQRQPWLWSPLMRLQRRTWQSKDAFRIELNPEW